MWFVTVCPKVFEGVGEEHGEYAVGQLQVKKQLCKCRRVMIFSDRDGAAFK